MLKKKNKKSLFYLIRIITFTIESAYNIYEINKPNRATH